MENYKNLEIKFFNHQGKKMGMKTEESCFTFFFPPFNSRSYINNLVLMIVTRDCGKNSNGNNSISEDKLNSASDEFVQ